MKERTYIAIDLKRFYASVECRERGLDPMDTNLVVADESPTDKTICLAVTPSLKSYGISGRCININRIAHKGGIAPCASPPLRTSHCTYSHANPTPRNRKLSTAITFPITASANPFPSVASPFLPSSRQGAAPA